MKLNKLSSATILLALPVLAGASSVPVQGGGAVGLVPASEGGGPTSEDLERALEAIQPSKVSADIHFIASDDMAGRDSPSPGLRIAARYIRARLERLGFQPGAQEQSYFWEYQLTQHVLDENESFATLTWDGVRQRLTFGRDYFLSPRSRHNRDATGEIVYGGGFDEDEVEGLELDGKWVLLEPGTRLSRRRTSAAEKMGVAGFLVPADPDAETSVEEAFRRNTTYMRQSSLRGARGGGVPSVNLAESWSEKLFSADLEVGGALPGTFHEAWQVDAEPVMLENVCGLWPGSDPKLKGEVIILSAHYDHVGVNQAGEIHNGADDNGSGTTGLLAVAEALKAYGPMRRTVMLMWVSAEEKGLLGSRAWTEDPWLPEGMSPLCNINIDMIGRNAPDAIGITPTKARSEYNMLTRLVEEHMGLEGFTTLNNADAYWARSDHANFSQNLKIPVAFLFSDIHDDYHKPTDDPDKIDVDKLSRVARLVVRLLHGLQVDDLEF